MRESTNPNLTNGGHEETPNRVSGTQWYNDQQRVHSEEGTRFNEHHDDGFTQPADPGNPQGGASVPAKQDEPDNDHVGEEDVERERNRIVWKSGPDGAGNL